MRFTEPFCLDELAEREWILPNGLGGYASSTLCGMNTRRYHGLLVAALHPPGRRVLLVAKVEETIALGEERYELATNQYPDATHPLGFRYLREFELDGDRAITRFAAGNGALEKTVSVVCGANATRVAYRNTGAFALTLALTPLVNARDFHGDIRAGEIAFEVEASAGACGPQVHLRPSWLAEGFWLSADNGIWQDAPAWHERMYYAWEARRGLTPVDNHFAPGHFLVELAPGDGIDLLLSTAPPDAALPAAAAAPCHELIYMPDDAPEAVRQLYRTAHGFLAARASVHAERFVRGRTIIAGYHWFGDWGRDTMIALPGLCLTTRRYADAAEILRTFAAARRRGLLPNLFLDSGEGEAYNAADASLWFIYALDRYARATGDRDLVNELRPAAEEIIRCYRDGTDFGIGMTRDVLIEASAPGWQLTWMDAKVGDWVVTPRMGKPVEINALWYNALRVMEGWAHELGWPDEYGALAERVRRHFRAFWNPVGKYLYDVLGDTPDVRIRPNQIFAVSLPHSPLDLARARAVVRTVERYLLTPYGLRTLAPQDEDYRGTYGGDVWERDGAYHQGTVWAWLIGPYIDAYLRVYGATESAKAAGRALLAPLFAHLREAGLGTISEIFEGDPPHQPCGAISQAWSVAEVLRAWEKCRPE